ncbi:hypothetical protein Pan54_33200 [Rubinisphaera italica]|uniref:Uncharacterized protein n=1 Tax=Rubinisphaera italica TaxID=2527969 RepID=A0A5C5XHL0_9PLAN|nr:hypothetical protein Pan54_33200 [Rubinisphaera italica]
MNADKILPAFIRGSKLFSFFKDSSVEKTLLGKPAVAHVWALNIDYGSSRSLIFCSMSGSP